MQKETVIREIPIVKAVASEGLVLTVLSYLKNGDIEKALASFAEEFRFKDHGIGLEFTDKKRLAEFFEKTRELYPDAGLQADAGHNPDFTKRVRVNQKKLRSELRSQYDFVVCGSGSSGSVVAGRLAENADVSVLLIEAGGDDEIPSVTDARQWVTNIGSETYWQFKAEPNPHLNGRAIPLGMGKVLGGGSSVLAGIGIQADVKSVVGSTVAATNMQAELLSMFSGVISNDSAPGTTTFTANTSGSPGLSSINGFYSGPSSVIAFWSGSDLPKAAKITGYTYAAGVGTFTIALPGLPTAPAVGDKFIILGLVI